MSLDLNFVHSAYFNTLSDALEVQARTTAVNEKITYAAEVRKASLHLVHFALTPYDRYNPCCDNS